MHGNECNTVTSNNYAFIIVHAQLVNLGYTNPQQVWSALPTGGRDTSTVVVSPRLALLPDATWMGIVAHELGHCIDFALFGRCGMDVGAAAVLLMSLQDNTGT